MQTKQTLKGSTKFPFSEMVQDTIATHGVNWAFDYYCVQNDLPLWQWNIYSGLNGKIEQRVDNAGFSLVEYQFSN